MLVSEFHYDLPPERIAQEPLPDRAGSRLLHVTRQLGRWQDRSFREFPALLRPDDLLVVNNTRVFPARLLATAAASEPGRGPAQSGGAGVPAGQVEVLLTRRVTDDPNSNDQNDWGCLVRPGRKIGIGEKLYFGDPPALEAEVIERGSFGERRIRFAPVDDFMACLDRIGHVPLPPYIHREHDRDGRQRTGIWIRSATRPYTPRRRGRRQGRWRLPRPGCTSPRRFWRRFVNGALKLRRSRCMSGSELFSRYEWKEWRTTSCIVSATKFQRKRHRRSIGRKSRGGGWWRGNHHSPHAGARRRIATKLAGKRSEERTRGVPIEAGRGDADVFLYPGHRFRIVDALLTNFHLPQSTLLMLVCALGGKDLVMDAYRHAVEAGYRFYSYGDCMFVE